MTASNKKAFRIHWYLSCRARTDVLTSPEIKQLVSQSDTASPYKEIDRESAYKALIVKLTAASEGDTTTVEANRKYDDSAKEIQDSSPNSRKTR